MVYCKECLKDCFKDSDEGKVISFFEKAMKDKKYLGMFDVIEKLLENNPNNCPTYIIIILRKVAKSIKTDGLEQHWNPFMHLVMSQFDNMETNNLGWTWAKEIIEAISSYRPELEKPLREHLHNVAIGE
jgi:hypothetical protein